MAFRLMRSSIAAVMENVSSNSSKSIQLKEAAQKLLDRIMLSDGEIVSFDEFSESVVSYIRGKIEEVTKDVSFVSSKRAKIWVEFHQIKLDNSGLLYSAWKNLLNNLHLALNDSPLLMQCVYDEIYIHCL